MNEKMNETPLFKTEEGKQAVFDFYDNLLADWGMDYEAQFVPTEFGETHVISVGENGAPPLVLLHGSSSNATMWLADMKVFAKDFRVHAVDIVGQPGKSAEVRPDLTGDGYALWMRDVLHGLGLSKAALMGNSLGGLGGFEICKLFPRDGGAIGFGGNEWCDEFEIVFHIEDVGACNARRKRDAAYSAISVWR